MVGVSLGFGISVSPHAVLLALALSVVLLGTYAMIRSLKVLRLVLLTSLIYYVVSAPLFHFLPASQVVGTVLPDSLALLMLVAALFHVHSFSRRWIRGILLFMIVISACGLLSGLSNQESWFQWVFGIRDYIRYVGLAIVAYVAVGDDSRVMWRWVFGLGQFEAIVAYLQALLGSRFTSYFFPPQTHVGSLLIGGATQFIPNHYYVPGTLGRYTTLGPFLALLLAINILSPMGNKFKYSPVWQAVIIGAALLSVSRLGLICIAVGYGVAYWNRFSLYRFLKPLLIAASICVLGAVVWYSSGQPVVLASANSSILGRIIEVFNPAVWTHLSPNSLVGTQFRMWMLVFGTERLLVLRPILGFGPGSFIAQFPSSQWLALRITGVAGTVAGLEDNGWVAILGELGLVGVATYMSFMVFLWRGLRRAEAGTYMVIYLVLNQLSSPFVEGAVITFAFWILVGLLAAEQTP